jgi:hypothetical protein
MRLSAGLVIATALIGLAVLQNQRETAAPEKPASATAPTVAKATAPAAAPITQDNAQHWPKRALDRAADVKRQVADQRKSDETR